MKGREKTKSFQDVRPARIVHVVFDVHAVCSQVSLVLGLQISNASDSLGGVGLVTVRDVPFV